MGETESRIMNLIGKVAALEATVSMLEKKLAEVSETVKKLSADVAFLQGKIAVGAILGSIVGSALMTFLIKQIGG